MGFIFKVTFIGLASGVIGTGIGGLMAFFVKGVSNRILSSILEFSAGLMTAVVCFELIPQAFELGGTMLTMSGIILGIATIIVVENFMQKSKFLKTGRGSSRLIQTGFLTAIAIALHNLPEGFAVGSGFEASVKLGLTITIIILIHDIPEGMAMAVPLRAGGVKPFKAFIITILSGVPMGFGALFGAALGGISQKFICVCLGFASGAMLYIICGELVPQSKRLYSGRLPSLSNVVGILCGIIITIYN